MAPFYAAGMYGRIYDTRDLSDIMGEYGEDLKGRKKAN